MNNLLKRQIDKHLKGIDPDSIQGFLDAIANSYINFEEQISMLHRAIKLSSDELYEANQKLRDEADSLKIVNRNLESILNNMSLNKSKDNQTEDFNSLDYIKELSVEIVRINRQREELLVDLERQNQELNDYARIVSHDLKAPLRSIDTIINWFLEDYRDKIESSGVESLETVLFNVEKMDLLIKGILDYSTIDKISPDEQLIDLNQILKDVITSMDIPENINIQLNNKLPKLIGNRYRYMKLFENLISNAIKNIDKPYGTIEIGVIHKAKDYEFYVKDNGKGIAEKYFPKIFQVFSKLENNTKYPGIGLSIVKKIIEKDNGRIWVDSKEGTGSIFHFLIPEK